MLRSIIQGTICPVCASATAESIPVCVIFLSRWRNCDAAIVLLVLRLRTDGTSQTCSIRAIKRSYLKINLRPQCSAQDLFTFLSYLVSEAINLRGNCAPCLAAKLRSSLTGSISGAKMLTLTQKRGDAVHCTRGRTFAFNTRDWMEIPTNIPKQGSKLCCAPLVHFMSLWNSA